MTALTAGGSPGRCRYCRCTEDNPCRLETGEGCAWFNRGRTVCTNPACIAALFRARQGAKAAQSQASAQAGRRRTPGQVAALIEAEKKAEKKAANAKYRARLKLKKTAAKAAVDSGTRGIA